MNPYDQAHALARSLKDSEDYKEYSRLKLVAYEDATNKALLDEYKKLQFRMQTKMAAGESMPQDDLQRLQQIGTLLQFNPDVSAFLMAEFRFQRMLTDIFKILGSCDFGQIVFYAFLHAQKLFFHTNSPHDI